MVSSILLRPHSRSSARAKMKARFRSNRRQVMTSVHRGHWDPLPENSLAAIRAASHLDVVEIDIRIDANGTPYLMHDGTLDRTTGMSAPADGVDTALRCSAKLLTGAGGAYATLTEEPVPTLDEAFAALDGTGAVFDLDVKRAQDIEAVAEAVAALGCQELGLLKMDVATQSDIDRLVELERRYDIMVMAKLAFKSKADLALVVALREADVAAVEAWFDDLNLLASAAAFASDLMRFGTYTLDPVHCLGLSDARALEDPGAVWGRLIDAGVRSIMTDQPEALSRYLMTR